MVTVDTREVLSRAVRLGTSDDVEEIARLCGAAAVSVRQLQSCGDFLVLDGPGRFLAGVIYLAIDQGRARIEMLRVSPECSDSDLAERLVAVAELMCEASGCQQVSRQLGL